LEENWTLRDLVAGSDSVNSLLIGSVFGLVSAHFFFSKKIFDSEYFATIKDGASKILEPMLILVMAWFLGSIIKNLQIAQYILEIMPVDTTPFVLPSIIFLFSCLISFATGSSFSTMSIVYPMALPVVFEVCDKAGFSAVMNQEILYHSIACVLAGAVFGDHCSPISDTTVLSSIATECNHLDHVRTQMPYALVIGGVSFFISLTLANMQLPFLLVYGIGFLFLYLIVRVFGRTY
jgi:Na+/H+ antiporter NhaC